MEGNKHTLHIVILMIFLLCMSVEHIFADTKEAIFGIVKADSAYNVGEYARAAETYENVMEMHGVSASTLFNLGNCYTRLGDLGRARLCYERAKKLDPNNSSINNNLEYIKSKIEDANLSVAGKDKELVTQDSPSFWESVHNTVAINTSSNSWALFAAIAFVLSVAMIGVYIFTSYVSTRKVGFFGAIIFFICSLGFIALAVTAANEFDSRKSGVIIAYKVNLLSNPSAESKPTGPTLTHGTRLQVEEEEIDSDGKVGWYRVRLNSRVEGWIKRSDYEII